MKINKQNVVISASGKEQARDKETDNSDANPFDAYGQRAAQ